MPVVIYQSITNTGSISEFTNTPPLVSSSGELCKNKRGEVMDIKIRKVITAATIIAIVSTAGSGVMTKANEPLYDDEGNLLLDVPQEEYKDLTTPKSTIVDDAESSTENETGGDTEITEEEEEEEEEDEEEEDDGHPEGFPAEDDGYVYEPLDPITGYMVPVSQTYTANENDVIEFIGEFSIAKVTQEGKQELHEQAYVVSGNKVVFNTNILNEAYSGMYQFRVEFINGATGTFSIKVNDKIVDQDFWTQSSYEYNKQKGSPSNTDLSLVSTNKQISVDRIILDDIVMPSSAYSVEGSRVLISKEYLDTLELQYNYHLNVMYNGDQYHDFIFDVIDEEVIETNTPPVSPGEAQVGSACSIGGDD